jgi:hypothetical protein
MARRTCRRTPRMRSSWCAPKPAFRSLMSFMAAETMRQPVQCARCCADSTDHEFTSHPRYPSSRSGSDRSIAQVRRTAAFCAWPPKPRLSSWQLSMTWRCCMVTCITATFLGSDRTAGWRLIQKASSESAPSTMPTFFAIPTIRQLPRLAVCARQISVVAKAAELEPYRLVSWVLAWAGLSAAFSLEDRTAPNTALKIAELALAEMHA